MELIIVLASLVFGVLYVALFVKIWMMTDDVSFIKNSLSKNNDNQSDFPELFYSYILSGQNEKATSILFEKIRNDQDYKGIFNARNELYTKQQSETLNKRYEVYLRELNMGNIDFAKININQGY